MEMVGKRCIKKQGKEVAKAKGIGAKRNLGNRVKGWELLRAQRIIRCLGSQNGNNEKEEGMG